MKKKKTNRKGSIFNLGPFCQCETPSVNMGEGKCRLCGKKIKIYYTQNEY